MISIQNLSAGYSRKKQVFSKLDLHLGGGTIAGLLGKNGSGKSTLLRLLQGLRFAAGGQVSVLGHNPALREPDFLQQVFMVPEEFHLPDVQIKELVRYQAGFYPRFSMEQFEQYLDSFEIPQAQRLQQMSYGQKKKVLISLGLASHTPLLLMDEPTNGLDIISKSQFRKTITQMPLENRCILISTHQVKDLENMVSHILILDEARILFDQPLKAVCKKLHFGHSATDEVPCNALYSEKALNGSLFVAPNPGDQIGKYDLELLYKTVMHEPQTIQQLFST
jgi:ABC-2 type transport system ATP-binding protein